MYFPQLKHRKLYYFRIQVHIPIELSMLTGRVSHRRRCPRRWSCPRRHCPPPDRSSHPWSNPAASGTSAAAARSSAEWVCRRQIRDSACRAWSPRRRRWPRPAACPVRCVRSRRALRHGRVKEISTKFRTNLICVET